MSSFHRLGDILCLLVGDCFWLKATGSWVGVVVVSERQRNLFPTNFIGCNFIIKEDKLGLDAIYIQAKRWANTVGRPETQKFVGALTGQRAKKGLFITTADFTAEAKAYTLLIDTKVVLIDGEMLAQLMIDYGIGISTVATYEIKKIDLDYFLEE